jgi:hypothetical protein
MPNLAFDPSGNLVTGGVTSSANFPTTDGAYDRTFNGSYDACIARISSDGSVLVWCTFLGGYAGDSAQSLAVDSLGNVFISGQTASSDFPATPGAFDTTWNGSKDAFVAELSSTGSVLIWSTFFGGNSDEWGPSIALDPSGDAVVVTQGGSDAYALEAIERIEFLFDVSGVEDPRQAPGLIKAIHLFQNRPNPMTTGTQIGFDLPQDGKVEPSIYDPGGRLVRTLLAEERATGRHPIAWDGTNEAGRKVPGRVYF